ncbi:NUMOD4 domain-containing protein [Mycolicibacterium brisbanense]
MTDYYQEVWVPVRGYEGLYEVSDLGRVRSLDRDVPSKVPGKTMRLRGRLLKQRGPSKRRHHYAVALHSDGHRRDALVHRLVLESFIGPCPEGLEGCHRNDDPSDNSLSNLRWDSRGSNQKDSVRNGRHGNTRKTECRKGHPYDTERRRADGRTYRVCSKCARRNRQAYNARQRRVAA